MALITTTQAANLSAPIKYVKGVREGTGATFWHAWVGGKEDTGPHALIERNRNGTYRSCRLSRTAAGMHNGQWLGGFTTRKLAAHAALVAPPYSPIEPDSDPNGPYGPDDEAGDPLHGLRMDSADMGEDLPPDYISADDEHLALGLAESVAANGVTSWETFVDRCQKLCARHLHTDADGGLSFDGDNDRDGYSLDWLHEQFEAGRRPLDVLHNLLWRKCGLHQSPAA